MRSPESTTQLREHLIAGNKLNFTALELANTTFNLDAPRLFYVRITGTIEGFDQGERKFGSLNI